MVLVRNKRGIFFTAFVIVILSLFVISFTFFSNSTERKTTQNRVATLNNFVFSVEEDIPRQLRISAFRIIFLLEKDIIETGLYITDINSAFEEAFFDGTINGKTSQEINSIMQGAKFSDIAFSLQEDKAKKINANVSLLSPSITIIQEDPWNIKFTLTTNIIIKDLSNLAVWNKTANISAYVSIQGFEDPIYIKSTNGLVTNRIIKSPYNGTFIQGADVSNLYDLAQNSYYINSTDAPSFLDRLQGINSPNENGIESLVNLAELSSQSVPIQDKSVVDHIYFSTANPPSCNILPSGMPSWFKLDGAHFNTYQVAGCS